MPTDLTDIIVPLILLFFLWRGWKRGIFRSLISPFFFCIFFILSIALLDINKDIIQAITLIVLGTLISSFVVNVLIMLAKKSVSKEYKNYVFIGSRFLGSMISLGWKGGVFIYLMFLLTVLPAKPLGLLELRNKLLASQSYALANSIFISKIPSLKNSLSTVSILANPVIATQYLSADDYGKFYEHPKIIALKATLTKEKLANKNQFFGVLTSPAIKSIKEDPVLMETLTEISGKVYALEAKEEE